MKLYIAIAILALFFFSIQIYAGYSLQDYGLNGIEGTLAAVGDFDSDKQADLFIVRHVLSDALYIVDWYRYNSKSKEYQLEDWVNPVFSPNPIYSVIPGDYNYDGRLDILITGPNPESTTGEYYLHIFFGDADIITPQKPFVVTPQPIGQVASMSISGNLRPDLFGMSINTETQLPQRATWSFSQPSISNEEEDPIDPTHPEVIFRLLPIFSSPTNPKLTSAQYPYLAKGFAPVLGDVNGDCAADLILVTTSIPPQDQLYPGNDPEGNDTAYDPTQIQYDTSKQIEIWVLDRSSTSTFPYVLHFIFPAYLGVLQPTVGDVNKDGALDIIIPYCYPYATCEAKNSIEVYYNEQRGMCSSLSLSTDCRSATDLCTADSDFTFDYIGMISSDSTTTQITNTSTLRRPSLVDKSSPKSQQRFRALDSDDDSDDGQPTYYKDKAIITTISADFENRLFQLPALDQDLTLTNLPFQLRISDINLDGNLDFVFPVVHKTESNAAQLYAITSQSCGGDDDCDSDLYRFSTLGLSDIFSNSNGAYAVALLDFGNTGAIDMIVLAKQTTYDPDTQKPIFETTTLTTFVNNFHTDSYFLTLLGSNGVCQSWCNGLQFPSPKPYGVNQQGLTFKYTITALSGGKSPRIFMQGAQSAYTPLNPPYVLSGLGRTSNYIEELYLGIPSTKQYGGSSNSNLFQAMIPNSQVVIFPYPITSPVNWGIESFISPTARLLAVFIAFLATTAACCIVIGILHLREKLAEQELKKQRQRLFAF